MDLTSEEKDTVFDILKNFSVGCNTVLYGIVEYSGSGLHGFEAFHSQPKLTYTHFSRESKLYFIIFS